MLSRSVCTRAAQRSVLCRTDAIARLLLAHPHVRTFGAAAAPSGFHAESSVTQSSSSEPRSTSPSSDKLSEHSKQAPWEDSLHPRQRSAEHEHFKIAIADEADKSYMLEHPIWTDEEKNSVEIQHRKCVTLSDYAAYGCVRALRFNFDLFSGYYIGNMDESKWLTRIVFLETVAGVPGMVGAMIRHLHSLRLMRRDYGWIHTLLEEAENERMHLLTALTMKKPTKLFSTAVLVSQGIFVNFWFLAYLISPRFCHRFVGFLEEEAVITYTKVLKQLDNNQLPLFSKLPAPPIAIKYWRLSNDASMRDVLLSIRADEGHHRDVNHFLANHGKNVPNPYGPGK